jgi:acetyl-CoA acetyltransferase family protein
MPEAFVIDAVRTPIGRRNGGLSGMHPAQLLAAMFVEIIERTRIDPASVDDVIVGCMEQVGEQSNTVGRSAWLAGGLPETVPATTIERQCTSSQQALHFGAQAIMAGVCETVIVGGVESMSRVPIGVSTTAVGGTWYPASLADRYAQHSDVGGVEISQFESADLIGKRWDIDREEQEQYALRSHQRAGAARAGGVFAREIGPIRVDDTILTEDECIRPDTSLERMAQLSPVLTGGRVTAATSSQIADGAAVVLLMSEAAAARAGLRPRARFRAFDAIGHDFIEGLTAIIPATRRVLKRCGLEIEDIDAVEINEAFAVVPLAWQRALEVPRSWFDERVNAHGGAIALGHPIGCSGVRLTVSLLNRLDEVDGRYGIQTICGSYGLATALVLERMP